MIRYLKHCFPVSLCFLAACATDHDMAKVGPSAFGTGYTETELAPGVYHVLAVGVTSPLPGVSTQHATSTWDKRVTVLCGPAGYDVIEKSEGVNQSKPYRETLIPVVNLMPRYNAHVIGRIVCKNSGKTVLEASNLILAAANSAPPPFKREIETQPCTDSSESLSTEEAYRRGKLLVTTREFQPAMVCFFKVHAAGPRDRRYKEACLEIGMLYELGLGVDKNLVIAKSWFKEGGF